MEAPLTNRCTIDRGSLQKAYRILWRPRMILLLFFSAVMMVCAILLICSGGFGLVEAVLLICAAAYVLLALTQPARFAKLQLRRMQENYQADSIEFCTDFYPDELSGRRNGAESATHMRYANIKSVKLCPGLILLWTKGRQFNMLDPARFENGTEADFWRLMNEKCPKAVPRAKRTL
ncbi:MAG: hypothetical protein II062_03410 [Oscillospiraceae bacterium]|nr:hypothetical protein [Oscillospiraceae bacterium]